MLFPLPGVCGQPIAVGPDFGHAARMRPLLRPGTHLLRRTDGSLQIGLDPAHAVVVPDSPDLRASLIGGLRPTTGNASEVLDLLQQQDLLVDERTLMPLIGGPGAQPSLPRGAAAALARDAGDRAGDRVAVRERALVRTVCFGHHVGAELADQLHGLLGRTGLRVEAGSAGDPAPAAHEPEPVLGVLIGVGEPDRELLDPWMRAHLPLLLVRLTEGRAVIGPFVAPGRTACVRCIDAHHTDADLEWPLLVRQYAAASSTDRADGAPEPVDPALAALAVAWAARDVASYVDGERPSTWSTTLIFDGTLGAVESRSWLRHPECGCSWA